MNLFTYDHVLSKSTEYFHGDQLAAEVFFKYCLQDNDLNYLEETPRDMHWRQAKELHRIEKNKFKNPYSAEFIFSLLDNFKYILLQGSPAYGIGNPYKFSTLSNCYVVDSPADSYAGILKTDEELAQLSKRRGGVGTDLSNIRPNKAPTLNSSKFATGILPYMDRYSNTIMEVGQEGRRGAEMLTLADRHPQIMEFIRAKNDPKKVNGANISVRLHNDFLNAVENDLEFLLRWPIDSANPSIVKNIRAFEIWQAIIHNAWLRAEPGILFWDRIVNFNAIDCYADMGFKTISTNPCSELPLCADDSCRLMIQNLYSYVVNPFAKNAYFDFKLYYQHAQILQRLMDDMIDLEVEKIDAIIGKINRDPEDEFIKQRELSLWQRIKFKCENGRRTGCGITALGDTFAALNLPYAQDESIILAEEIAKTQKLGALRSSVDMAKELGAFPIWNWDKEKNSQFLLPIQEEDPQLYKDMAKYGRRNIGHLTIAPTGSKSILAQTSAGVEPVFMLKYTRRKKINLSDVNAQVDFVDDLGQQWKHFDVYHPKVLKWMEVTGKTDIKESPWYGSTAEEIDWKNRVKLQAAMQKHIDHAISSCLAVGKNYVLTSHGLLDIGELADKYKVNLNENIKKFTEIKDDIFSINSKNKQAAISAIYNNGLAEVLKFNLDNGSEITCTKNHKLMVLNKDYSFDWKESGLITEDDWIVGRKGLNIWGSTGLSLTSMVGRAFEYKKLTNSKNIYFPVRMSTDLARLLGYLCSDGSVGVNGILLSQVVNNIGPDFCNIVEKIFKVKTAISPDLRTNNLYQYVVNSRELAAFFKWLGVTNHDEIRVPKVIRMSGYECVKNFIRGVTLDGHVSKDNIIVATSVNHNYLKDIRELLLNIGIESKIFTSSKVGSRVFPSSKVYNTKESYCLTISDSNEIKKFVEMIGFAENRKNEELKTKYKRSTKIKLKGEIPDYGLRLKFRSSILPKIKSCSLYEKYHSLTVKDKQGRLMSRETLLEMQDLGFNIESHLIDNTYTFSKVRNIQNDGFQQTVDLSVPAGNSYIANGLISHNTINLPEDVTEDKVAEIFLTAWKSGCKGITVYRKNCRTGVMIDSKDAKKEDSINKNNAPKRPKELKAECHFLKTKGEEYYAVVGLLNNEPYEIFTGKNVYDGTHVIERDVGSNCIVKKVKRGTYELLDNDTRKEFILNNGHSDDNVDALTRMISTSLRHGADISFVVHQLEKTKGDMSAFAKVLSRILKKYIKNGTKVHGESCPSCQSLILERSDGCVTCKSCGWTKCN